MVVLLVCCCCAPEFVPDVYGLLEREREDVLGLVIGDDERDECFLYEGLFERCLCFNDNEFVVWEDMDGEDISLSVPFIISINWRTLRTNKRFLLLSNVGKSSFVFSIASVVWPSRIKCWITKKNKKIFY